MNPARRVLVSLQLFVAWQSSYAAPTDNALAVVLTDSPGIFVDRGTPTTLKKAEVVRVISRSDGFSKVQRIDNPPDWETITSQQIQLSKTPIKISTTALALLTAFRRLSTWNVLARGQYTACDGGCDFGVTYFFRSDGSFTGTSGSAESEEKIVGHLFYYRDLYWARASHSLTASRYSVFYTQGARAICDMIDCGEQ